MVCVTVNFVMGCGYLGLAWGLVRSGVVTGVVISVIAALISFTTIMYEVETMVRTDALLRLKKRPKWPLSDNSAPEQTLDAPPLSLPAPSLPRSSYLERNTAVLESPIEVEGKAKAAASGTIAAVGAPLIWRQNTTICHLLYGEKIAAGYCVLLCLGYLGSCWAFAQVFGSSLARHVPLPGINNGVTCNIYDNTSVIGSGCWDLYSTYVGIFALITGVLMIMDARDRMPIMFMMLFGRVAVVLVMTITVCFAMYMNDLSTHVRSLPINVERAVIYQGQTYAISEKSRIESRIHGIGLLIPITLFCQTMNGCASAVARTATDPQQIKLALGLGIGITMLMYIAVGASSALFFGHKCLPASNLNWQNYPWLKSGEDDFLLTRAVRILVILLPAAQVLTTFPLIIGMLGDNVAALSRLYWAAKDTPIPLSPSRKGRSVVMGAIEDVDDADGRGLRFRLAIAAFPILGATLFHDMIGVIDYTGTISVVVCVIIPAILQRRTIAACEKWRKCKGDTIYHVPCLSTTRAAFAVQLVGCALLMLVLATTL